MAALIRKASQQVLFSDLKVADTYWSRMVGLIGTKSLSDQQAMWFQPGNWIHSYFMSIAIDCVFLDRKLKIVSIVEDFKPGRLGRPQWGAKSVIEMNSGRARSLSLQVGEELYVSDSHTER